MTLRILHEMLRHQYTEATEFLRIDVKPHGDPLEGTVGPDCTVIITTQHPTDPTMVQIDYWEAPATTVSYHWECTESLTAVRHVWAPDQEAS